MKKVKFFFFFSLLLLLEIGVFAGKKKYTTGSIYARCGSSYCQLTTSTTLVNLTTTPTGCAQATISTCSGSTCALYLFNGVTYTALYLIVC